MGKRKQSRKAYGKTAHYWPVEMQPFWVASACIDIVLRSSERASIIYREAKEAWGRPDCQNVLNEVTIPFSSILAAIEAVSSNKMSDYPDPLSDIKEQYKDSIDFKYLIERVNEFIKIGFNRKEDVREGKYKVIPSQETWLFYAVFIGALVDFCAERPDWDTYKLIEFKGKTYDPITFMDPEHNNRKYRRKVASYKDLGWHLRQDKKLRNMARLWYLSRVVYSGPEKCCIKLQLDGENWTSDNLVKEIYLCDIATGYPRRNLPEQSLS